MAGHSKWANIKHRKGAQDKKRGKLFTRCIKDIYVAVKEGGDDSSSNPRLKLAIQNAKGVNMPKDTIERAIKKASSKDSESYIETAYEGYGPGGVAFFIECATDNINRTVANIRAIFNKYRGELGKNGSLEFLFKRIGIFELDKNIEALSVEELEMELIDGGLEEFEVMEESYFLSTNFENFGIMQKKLETLQITPKSARLDRVPLETTKMKREEARSILNMIEKFEDDDDVQEVFHSLEIIQD
jgi:YebC/PmpR family DNA-binding regulatory protein